MQALMNRSERKHLAWWAAKLIAVLAMSAALLAVTGCNKLKARDQLNKGVQAYKNSHFEEAIERFKNAVALDPNLNVARLYLATAYAQQYIPGADTPENNRLAEQAIEEFKKVLEKDRKSINSVKGIAALYFQMKKFDQAKEYHNKAKQLDPNDPEAYYAIGVIDWTQSYAPRMEERAKIGLKPDEQLKDKKVCAALKDKNWNVIMDGIDNLKKALELRPDYDDAMAYMNLLFREKADLECEDLDQRQADLKTADDWVAKTMITKKQKAEKAAQPGGITLEQPSK
jgi:tetratricopeptide (TPR) repeat protein